MFLITVSLFLHLLRVQKRLNCKPNYHSSLIRQVDFTCKWVIICLYCLTKISIRAKRSISRVFSLFFVPSPFFCTLPVIICLKQARLRNRNATEDASVDFRFFKKKFAFKAWKIISSKDIKWYDFGLISTDELLSAYWAMFRMINSSVFKVVLSFSSGLENMLFNVVKSIQLQRGEHCFDQAQDTLISF